MKDCSLFFSIILDLSDHCMGKWGRTLLNFPNPAALWWRHMNVIVFHIRLDCLFNSLYSLATETTSKHPITGLLRWINLWPATQWNYNTECCNFMWRKYYTPSLGAMPGSDASFSFLFCFTALSDLYIFHHMRVLFSSRTIRLSRLLLS